MVLIFAGLLCYNYVGLIFNKDPLVLGIFTGMFFMVLISLPFNAVAFTLDAIFKGLGEMAYLRNVLLGSTFLGFLPILLLSNYMEWGLIGIWGAIIVWVGWRALALIIKYRKKYLPLALETQKELI